MTAGSGIIHQEMPKGQTGGLMWGFQLWANLPASQKMIYPQYRGILSNQIPEISNGEKSKVKIICGEVNGTKGPATDIVIDPEYIDVTISPESNFSHKVKNGNTVFAYVIDGEAHFDQGKDPYAFDFEGVNYFDLDRNCLINSEKLVIFGDGEEVEISTGEKSVRFLLISGKPIRESIAWQGPIVMNTQEQLRTAFEEYQNGTFIKSNNNKDIAS
jgi:redox-sensitive bicupin YhaK (pirin superfamily)